MNPTSTKFGVVTPPSGTTADPVGNTIGGQGDSIVCNPPMTLKVVGGRPICYTLQCLPGVTRTIGGDGRYQCLSVSCPPGEKLRLMSNGQTACAPDRLTQTLQGITNIFSSVDNPLSGGGGVGVRGFLDFISEHKIAAAVVAAGGVYLISKSGKKGR